MRSATFALLLLACTGAGAQPADPGLARLIDAAVGKEVVRGFSGAVLVARGKDVLLDKAYGVERGTPMRAGTRFWLASLAKQFTSAAMLRCAERGPLRLDDPISTFFPAGPPEKRAITVRQLLTHLSGLDQSHVSEGARDRETAVARILQQPLIDAPGARFHYSNSNYELAVAIVEMVSRRPYRAFVTEELWRPARLRDTGFSGQPGAAAVAPARELTPSRLSGAVWGGAGVYSTAHDLLRWYRALRAGRVLVAASVEMLFAGVAPIGEGQTALGWFVGQTEKGATRYFSRGNEDFGPNTLLYAYPATDTVIIVLSHAGDASDDASWSRLVHASIERLLSL